MKSEISNLKFKQPRIYPITDESISGISHAVQVERLIAAGAEVIQLREKFADSRTFFESSVKVLEFARDRGVKIIINDRVDIALAAKADGVHLGQNDLPPEKARDILGKQAIIGFSTHSVGQAVQAMRMPIDYIAIGPIFPTDSKEKADAVVGLKGLREVRDIIRDFPLVAIGGINADNLVSVFEAGADSVAMIGAIVSDPENIDVRMRVFTELALRFC